MRTIWRTVLRLDRPWFPVVLLLVVALLTVAGVTLGTSWVSPEARQKTVLIGQATAEVQVATRVLALQPGNFPDRLTIRIESVALRPEVAAGVAGASEACLTRLQANYLVRHSRGARDGGAVQTLDFTAAPRVGAGSPIDIGQASLSLGPPICVRYGFGAPTDAAQTASSRVDQDFDVDLGQAQSTAYFAFPYDRMTVWATFQAEVTLYNGSGSVIRMVSRPAAQTLSVSAGEWAATGEERRTILKDGQTFSTGVEMGRTDPARFFLPALGCFFVLAVFILPFLAFRRALETVVGLALSIYGLRKEFLPDDVPGTAALDVLILSAYLLVALGLVLSGLRHLCQQYGAKPTTCTRYPCLNGLRARLRELVATAAPPPPPPAVEAQRPMDV